jgi:hypothetical protein
MVLYSLDEVAAGAAKSAAVLVDRAEHDEKAVNYSVTVYPFQKKNSVTVYIKSEARSCRFVAQEYDLQAPDYKNQRFRY